MEEANAPQINKIDDDDFYEILYVGRLCAGMLLLLLLLLYSTVEFCFYCDLVYLYYASCCTYSSSSYRSLLKFFCEL